MEWRPSRAVTRSDGEEREALSGEAAAQAQAQAKTEAQAQARACDRLTFFSDAVVAIALTLLAVDLPVPEGRTASQLWTSFQHHKGDYAAFLISFLAITVAWSLHHDVFRYARTMDPRLRTLNAGWLLTIVLNPFATRLLTERGDPSLGAHALRFGFYSLLQALASMLMLVMVRHLVRRGETPGIPDSVVSSSTWQSWGVLAGFGLSIPVFFATTYAWLLWALVPLFLRKARRLRHRRG